jgi:hypothetical protein
VVLTNGTGLPLTTGVTGILPIANGGTATATPALVQGTNVTITGTWPNQTIAASGAAGPAFGPVYKATYWYPPLGVIPTAGVVFSTTTVYCTPFFINTKSTWGAIGATIQTLSVGGNLQLALYNDDGAGRPGTLVDSVASMSTTSSGVTVSNTFAGGNHQLNPGLYWVAAMMDNATAKIYGTVINGSGLNIGSSTIAGATTSGSQICSVSTTGQTFGTWPSLAGSTWTALGTGGGAYVALQAVSVP